RVRRALLEAGAKQDQEDERVLEKIVVERGKELTPEQRSEPPRGHQRVRHSKGSSRGPEWYSIPGYRGTSECAVDWAETGASSRLGQRVVKWNGRPAQRRQNCDAGPTLPGHALDSWSGRMSCGKPVPTPGSSPGAGFCRNMLRTAVTIIPVRARCPS